MSKSMPATHHQWSTIPIEPMNPLLGRQFVSGAHVMVSRITLARGAHVPLHSHHNEQVAYLLTGCLKFVIHEPSQTGETTREVILRPDELLVLPPHVPHEVFALEDSVNLDIFSPPRQDWIDRDDAYLRT
jgi:quercetin dioxygenase-like cupin family protein